MVFRIICFMVGAVSCASSAAVHAMAQADRPPALQSSTDATEAAGAKPHGAPAREFPITTPKGPYPPTASGWGPPAGGDHYVIRWVEDWREARRDGSAPDLKAVPLGENTTLTVNAELRLRANLVYNEPPTGRPEYEHGLLRAMTGVDLRLGDHLRIYTEVGTGQVMGRRDQAPASFQNDASLQQAFIEGSAEIEQSLVGAIIGRQEFVDGPRQLISSGNGANLRRT